MRENGGFRAAGRHGGCCGDVGGLWHLDGRQGGDPRQVNLVGFSSHHPTRRRASRNEGARGERET